MSVKSVTLYLNGQSYDIPLDTATKKYKKSITAPNKTSWGETDHKYDMQLKVQDVAGNVTTIDKTHGTFGEKMKLRVLEKTPPIITITSPSSGAYLGNNAVKIEFTVTDTESGVDPDSITLQIDTQATVASAITKTEISGGYKCSYTATCSDGSHTIKVDASDNDGNADTQKSSNYTVDTVPPELNITSPATALITNIKQLAVKGSTNETCTIKITLNNADQGTVTLAADKTFEKTVELTKGSNVIVITATDLAGKVTTVTREVTYDPTAPAVISIDIDKNPVAAGDTLTITVEATDE